VGRAGHRAAAGPAGRAAALGADLRSVRVVPDASHWIVHEHLSVVAALIRELLA
jgi:hypothetical protein